MAGIDWKEAKNELVSALKEGAEGLLEGAAEDVEAYLADIAQDIVRARVAGKDIEQAHLEAQLDLLAAIHRIKVAKAANDTLMRVVGTAKRLAFGLLGGGSILGGIVG